MIVTIFKKIRTSVFISLFLCILSSCGYLSVMDSYETEEELNGFYDDTFTLISRDETNRDLVYSYYSSKKLQKTVTFIHMVTERNFASIATRSYSNYNAIKFEKESQEWLNAAVEDNLAFTKDDYCAYFDNKIYRISYPGAYDDFESFKSDRQNQGNTQDNQSDIFRNEETIYIAVKNSSAKLNKSVYLVNFTKNLSNFGFSSNIKFMFIDDSIEFSDLSDAEKLEQLYKNKQFSDCYQIYYDEQYFKYQFEEEK